MRARRTSTKRIIVAIILALLTTGAAVLTIFLVKAPPLLQSSSSGEGSLVATSENSIAPVRLTSGNSNDTDPALSQDDQFIVFASNRLGSPTSQIWTMKAADGSHLIQLTSVAGNATDPEWSSDGSKIAFIEKTNGFTMLWVINPDGSGLRNLTGEQLISNSFQWSHKGEVIAYSESVKGISNIILTDVQNSKNIVQIQCPQGGECYDPSFSPSDGNIVFVSKTEGAYELISANTRNGTTNIIFRSPLNSSVQVSSPEYSVDGESVYFLQKSAEGNSSLSLESTNWGVYVLNIGTGENTSARNILIPPPSMVYAQTWQPIITKESLFVLKPNNASNILVSGYSLQGTSDLFLVDENATVQEFAGGGFALTAPGISVERLTSFQYSSITGLMWALDSSSIVFSATSVGSTESHIFILRYAEVVQVNPYG